MERSAWRVRETRSFHLDAFLPLDRRRALAQGSDLEERARGTVLFADVSGFTPLMEHLATRFGHQQGAEEMTHLLNDLFTLLIDEVHGRQGSIVAFGGDALTCWFPGQVESAARCAVECVWAMLRHVAAFSSAEIPGGAGGLSMHAGIASGEVRRFCVGRPPHGLQDVLAGAAVSRVAEAQQRAAAGQVVVDAATAAALPGEDLSLPEGAFRLLCQGSSSPPAAAVPQMPPSLPAQQINRWVAASLHRRLMAGEGAFAAELRLVTSLFAQFSGIDYEDDPGAGSKLQQVVILAQEKLAPYEGYLALVHCGDEGGMLHVLFGAPIAHEDDPARAVAFALEFREAVRSLPFIREQRTGISLGRVYAGVLGAPRRCTYTVLGDEVNVSARLMQAANAGQILISRRVQQATAEHYVSRSVGTVTVKGKENPVPIFEPHAPRERARGGEGGRLIGREREMGTAAALISQVEVGRGHILLILGEAGVGKSALLREAIRQARGRGWQAYVGTCLSYGQHVPYLPWRFILEEACAITLEMGLAERATRLEEAVASLPDPADRPGYWRARLPLLAEAMGMELPDTPLTRSLEGELRRDNTFQLLEALVRQLAVRRPAAIVLEDAYWADELSLSLAAYVARGLADIPALLVLVHRPFTAPAPAALQALQSLPHQTTLTLDPLEQRPALELARECLHGAELPAPLEALLLEKAQGNPFFIEELLRALIEAGCVRPTDGTVELTGDWKALQLPETIDGVVRGRLDRLPEAERLTLKVAAVIGQTFQRPLLQAVHPGRPTEPALARQLVHLDRADFTRLEEPAPEWRYAFRHPILHEVTYETLLFAQRRQLHGAIGEVLEQWHAEELPRFLDLLAYHYARSEERAKALHYLQQAAEKARREYANEVALGYYSQALERLLPGEEALRYDLLAGRERIYDLLGERQAQGKDLELMGHLAEVLEDTRQQIEVLNRAARRSADMGLFEEARRIADQSFHLAEETGDQRGAAEAQRILGITYGSLGEYDHAHASFARSWEIYQQLEDLPGEASCLGNLGLIHLYKGDAEQAQSYHARALELVRMLGNRLLEARVLINLALAESNLGAYEQALERFHQALSISREIGSAIHEEVALDNIGVLATVLGDLSEASVRHQQALDLARWLQDREGEGTSLSNLGLLSIYQGDLPRARRFLEEALELYRAMGHRRGEATALHYQGIAELSAGQPQAAESAFHLALALRQEIGEAGNALVTRAWLGLACLDAGHRDNARTCLEQVLQQLEIEEYGGDDPEQEIWWAAYRVWQACGEEKRAREALQRAHRLVLEQASRIRDPLLRRSFLEQVPVNREIVRAAQR